MGFEELKEKQRMMWGLGAFERMERRIADMHERYRDGDAIRQSRTHLLTLGTRR